MVRALILLLTFAVGAGIGLLAPGYEPPVRPRPAEPAPEEVRPSPAPAEAAPAHAPAPSSAPTPAEESRPEEDDAAAMPDAERPVISGRILDASGRPVPDARIVPVPNPIYVCGRAARYRQHRYDTGEGEMLEDGTFVFRCREPVGSFPGPSGEPALFLVRAKGHRTRIWQPGPDELASLEAGRPLANVEIVLGR